MDDKILYQMWDNIMTIFRSIDERIEKQDKKIRDLEDFIRKEGKK